MEYKDLQQKAKALNLPYVGISEEELRKSIEKAETKPSQAPENPQTQPEESQDSKSSQKEQNKKQDKKEASQAAGNTAVVLNGSREVRRYTLEVHGDGFAELANQYAAKRGFTVTLKDVQPGITCPSCRHVFYPA